jgi:hypothetical protein
LTIERVCADASGIGIMKVPFGIHFRPRNASSRSGFWAAAVLRRRRLSHFAADHPQRGGETISQAARPRGFDSKSKNQSVRALTTVAACSSRTRTASRSFRGTKFM